MISREPCFQESLIVAVDMSTSSHPLLITVNVAPRMPETILDKINQNAREIV